MVFYRKYRPQKIDDLDSASVREMLFSVLSKEVPHAFLFTGPRGLGKTSTARIIAKVVNCEKGEREPCNECEQCESITNGTNMDVLEIDAASNRGIDEIRDLRDKIRLAPLASAKKVYIIDEVHMLTTEAFNALLKTLEEPPIHAIFILCTTEPAKVPETIVSRCFYIKFKRASIEEIMRSLSRVVDGEKLEIDQEARDEVLRSVGEMADGGFRDAVKILEELAHSSKGEKITRVLIEEKYKVGSVGLKVGELLEAMGGRDMKKALGIVMDLSEQGVDFRYFLQQLISRLHEMMLVEVGIMNRDIPRIMNYGFGLEEIRVLVEVFSKAYGEMKNAVIAQLPLEMAIVEFVMSNTRVVKSVDDVGVTVEKLQKQVGTMARIKALYGEPKVAAVRQVPAAKSDVELLQVPADGDVTAEWLASFWKNVLGEMGKYNYMVAGVLRSCRIAKYSKKQLLIEAASKFHKEKLDDMKTREALVKVCKILTGNDVEIEVKLKSRKNEEVI
jgi:DNA polymerase-3 subunit gamma/tau